MDGIRHWALALCVCCVLAGVLQLLLPAKGAGKVIKTVLALYILLSVTTPAPHADWAGFWQQLQQPPQLQLQPAFDLDHLAGEQLQQTIQQQLQALLAQNGIDAQVTVQASLDASTGQAELAAVTAVLGDPAQAQQAQQLLRAQLGSSVTLECKAKDGAV